MQEGVGGGAVMSPGVVTEPLEKDDFHQLQIGIGMGWWTEIAHRRLLMQLGHYLLSRGWEWLWMLQ